MALYGDGHYSSLRAFRRPALEEEARGQRRHDPTNTSGLKLDLLIV